jgi:hypothetical protein
MLVVALSDAEVAWQLYNIACEYRCFEECLAILFIEDSRGTPTS